MTTQVEAYNRLIRVGEQTYDAMLLEEPQTVKFIADRFEFATNAVSKAKANGCSRMDHIDTVQPDKWQIGIAVSLVKHGLNCIIDLLMREGLVTNSYDDARKAFKSLPRRTREDILMELSHNTFTGGMIADGTYDTTTATICTVAVMYLARVFDAHDECSKGSGRVLKERFTKEELKAMKGERKVAMKAFEEARKEFNTSRGFKN